MIFKLERVLGGLHPECNCAMAITQHMLEGLVDEIYHAMGERIPKQEGQPEVTGQALVSKV